MICGSGTEIKVFDYWQEGIELGNENVDVTPNLCKVPSEGGRGRVRKVMQSKPYRRSKKEAAEDISEEADVRKETGEAPSLHGHRLLVVKNESPMQVIIKEEPAVDIIEDAGEHSWEEELEESRHAGSSAKSPCGRVLDMMDEAHYAQVTVQKNPTHGTRSKKEDTNDITGQAEVLEKTEHAESSGNHGNKLLSVTNKSHQVIFKEEPAIDIIEDAGEHSWEEQLEEYKYTGSSAESPCRHDVVDVMATSETHSLQVTVKEELAEDVTENGESSEDLVTTEHTVSSGESPYKHNNATSSLQVSIKEYPGGYGIVTDVHSLEKDFEEAELAGPSDRPSWRPRVSKGVTSVELKMEATDEETNDFKSSQKLMKKRTNSRQAKKAGFSSQLKHRSDQKNLRSPPCENKYTCRLCNFRCDKAERLKQHTRNHYGESSLFNCGFCEYKFLQCEDLETHMRIHTGDLPYDCDVCDYKCSQKGQLEIHITHSHNFTCDSCGYECNQDSELEVHKKTHIRDHVFEDGAYKCAQEGQMEICKYKCSKDKDLKIHMKSHEGKTHSCPLCGYSSKKYVHYRMHLKQHKAETYKCDICDYQCELGFTLRNHINQEHRLKDPIRIRKKRQ